MLLWTSTDCVKLPIRQMRRLGVCWFNNSVYFFLDKCDHCCYLITVWWRWTSIPGTPASPVFHHLLEFAQAHVHQFGEAIQPSHPLSSPSPPALDLSQHQDFFQWVSSSHQVTKVFEASASASVLPMNIQDWFPLGLTGLILLSKGLSRVFSSTTVQKHQFFCTQPSLWSNSHIRTWQLEKP